MNDLVDIYLLAAEKRIAATVDHVAAGEMNKCSFAEYVGRQRGVGTPSLSKAEAIDV